MNGWIKLHRKFLKWEWYHNSEMVHLFLHLIIMANHEDKKWKGIIIKRGQIVTGRNIICLETGISIQSIRTCLNRLKSTNEITSRSTNRFSIITICNYECYQVNENDINQQINQLSNQQLTSNQPATNQLLTTNKNIKNIKKLKNIRNSYAISENFESDFLTNTDESGYGKTEKTDFTKIIEAFHSACPHLPKVQLIHQNRKNAITARINEVGEETLLKVFALAGQSEFLNGKNESRWTASLDWLLKPANFSKTLEGTYNKSTNHGNFKPNDPRASAASGWDEPL